LLDPGNKALSNTAWQNSGEKTLLEIKALT
jgi:hypothetical protein